MRNRPPNGPKTLPSIDAAPAQIDHDSWLALRTAVLGIPAMLNAALVSDHHAREDSIRVARIVRHLQADALTALGEQEAEDTGGATLRLVRGRIVDIFGPAAWNEALREP